MRTHLLACCCAAAAVPCPSLGLGLGAAPPTITLRATLRDMVPAGCARWVLEEDPSRTEWCPEGDVDAVLRGSFGGHSDFERDGGIPRIPAIPLAVTGPYENGFPVTYDPSKKVEGISKAVPFSDRIVEPALIVDSAGIPKPVRCNANNSAASSPPPRCDWFNSTNRQTFGDDFNAWFNDNPFYNRRAGFRQPLFLIAPNSSLYKFNSLVDSPQKFYDPIREHNLQDQVFPFAPFEQEHNNSHFSYTVEIHSFFQYSGSETFSFTGDDDVMVFVNSKLAIDLAGVHPRVGAAISLRDHESQLGIQVGGIYELDMFMAERLTEESNFLLTTSIVTTCNLASPVLDANRDVIRQNLTHTLSSHDLVLIGGPDFPQVVSSPSALPQVMLMLPSVRNAVSYAFLRNKFNLGTGFEFDFKFRMRSDGGGGGNGFAVVLHNRAMGLSNFNGGTGKNLGIKNLDRSIALVFDTCATAELPCGHVNQTTRIALLAPRDPTKMNGPSSDNVRVHDSRIAQNWKDGKDHAVELIFYGSPNWLEVYVDDSLRLRVKDFDPKTTLDGKNAYVGFTSSADEVGGALISVSSLVLRRVRTLARNSFDVPSPDGGNVRVGVADGRLPSSTSTLSNDSFLVGTRDACGQVVDFGSPEIPNQVRVSVVAEDGDASSSSGRRRTADNTVAGVTPTVVDLQNGQFAIRFASMVQGKFRVFVAVGLGCTWDPNLPGYVVTDPQECWVSPRSRVMEFVPPVTSSPTAAPPPVSPPLPLLTDSVMIIAGAASGGAIALCCCLALCLLGARRRWRRDKKFVPAGVLATLERDVEMHNDVEMTNLANEVQKSAQRVLSFRAVSAPVKRDEEVHELHEKVKELKDGVKTLKRNQFVAEVDRTVVEDTEARPRPGPSREPSFQRTKFAPTTVAFPRMTATDGPPPPPLPLPLAVVVPPSPHRDVGEGGDSLEETLLPTSGVDATTGGAGTPSPTVRMQRALEAGLGVVESFGKRARMGMARFSSSEARDDGEDGQDGGGEDEEPLRQYAAADPSSFDWKPPKPKGPPPLPPSRAPLPAPPPFPPPPSHQPPSTLFVTLTAADDEDPLRRPAPPPPPARRRAPMPPVPPAFLKKPSV